MNWWQTLIISSIPAIIAAAISLIQLKRAKKEIVEKYILEQKTHISKTRFDTEYAVYKELSEKSVKLIRNCTRMFPLGVQFAFDLEYEDQYCKTLYNETTISFDEASKAVYGYAIFIPENWFKKFDKIINDCHKQLQLFYGYKVIHRVNILQNGVLDECYDRTQEINNEFGELIKELREYIQSLDKNEA